MARHHTVTEDELTEWMKSEEAVFAASTRERKRLVCSLDGQLFVRVVGKTIYGGYSVKEAVEAYNSITEKYVEPKFTL